MFWNVKKNAILCVRAQKWFLVDDVTRKNKRLRIIVPRIRKIVEGGPYYPTFLFLRVFLVVIDLCVPEITGTRLVSPSLVPRGLLSQYAKALIGDKEGEWERGSGGKSTPLSGTIQTLWRCSAVSRSRAKCITGAPRERASMINREGLMHSTNERSKWIYYLSFKSEM